MQLPPLKKRKVNGGHSVPSTANADVVVNLGVFPTLSVEPAGLRVLVVSMDGSASFDDSLELSVAGWGFTAALPNEEHLTDFCGPSSLLRLENSLPAPVSLPTILPNCLPFTSPASGWLPSPGLIRI